MSEGPPQTQVTPHRRILSVDDEPGILLTRQLLLEIEGYDVLSTADGPEALGLFGQQDVDLVLLDYLRPGMNGGEVAQEIKRRKPSISVLIVSANSVPRAVLSRRFSCRK